MTSDFNITIIGAGVVGLSIAAELSKTFENIVVVEKHPKYGQETSSRNSEVIHSGIYYPTGSLKAKLCLEGNKLLYEYCDKKDIAYKKCGKLIVATNAQEVKLLDRILEQSQINGVIDGQKITKEEVCNIEPHVKAEAALHFPSTGIVDSFELMKQLQSEAINNGVIFAYASEIIAISKGGNYYKLTVKESQDNFIFSSNIVINAAGLHSDKIASLVGINTPKYELHYWKGEYFGVGNGKNKKLSRLIYPVPNKNTTGLGVHATIDLSGGLKLGPNSIYIKEKIEDYSVDKNNQRAFYESAFRFLPFIEEKDLHPDQAGLRPKLQKPGDSITDFIIKEESEKGLSGFINLIGIESPGLTSCLAIGQYVRNLILN